MNLDLQPHRAIVFGASQGIGRATAQRLATQGAAVTAVARRQEALDSVVAELPDHGGQHVAISIDLDQTDTLIAELRQIVDEWGPHTIVVNNSGGPAAGPIFEANPDSFLEAMRRHLIANQVIAQAMVPGMKEATYGRIINVISTSVYEPIPNLGVSNATRGAVASWAKTLSKELGPFAITVNSVLPGFTDTERLGSLIKGRAEREGLSEQEVAATMLRLIPAGRFAAAEELAGVIAFLASPAGSYINGVCLPVDGGRLSSI